MLWFAFPGKSGINCASLVRLFYSTLITSSIRPTYCFVLVRQVAICWCFLFFSFFFPPYMCFWGRPHVMICCCVLPAGDAADSHGGSHSGHLPLQWPKGHRQHSELGSDGGRPRCEWPRRWECSPMSGSNKPDPTLLLWGNKMGSGSELIKPSKPPEVRRPSVIWCQQPLRSRGDYRSIQLAPIKSSDPALQSSPRAVAETTKLRNTSATRQKAGHTLIFTTPF